MLFGGNRMRRRSFLDTPLSHVFLAEYIRSLWFALDSRQAGCHGAVEHITRPLLIPSHAD